MCRAKDYEAEGYKPYWTLMDGSVIPFGPPADHGPSQQAGGAAAVAVLPDNSLPVPLDPAGGSSADESAEDDSAGAAPGAENIGPNVQAAKAVAGPQSKLNKAAGGHKKALPKQQQPVKQKREKPAKALEGKAEAASAKHARRSASQAASRKEADRPGAKRKRSDGLASEQVNASAAPDKPGKATCSQLNDALQPRASRRNGAAGKDASADRAAKRVKEGGEGRESEGLVEGSEQKRQRKSEAAEVGFWQPLQVLRAVAGMALHSLSPWHGDTCCIWSCC